MAEATNYVPVKDLSIGGIIMVRQAQPGTPEELVEPVAGDAFYFCFFLALFANCFHHLNY
jgi:hypothetical protein